MNHPNERDLNEIMKTDIQQQPIRQIVTFSERRFDVMTLPADMQRVYHHLNENVGEEYALLFIFIMRTAVELHRAWHMTLLTSKILQGIKDKFGIRMTWNLGVTKLMFRVEDGGFQLNRKVPYDYDSEYQDIYMRIASALTEGRINVHEALIYQNETQKGIHTAKSDLFFRDFPGRLLLYPLQASTCAVIFFKGNWTDGGIAAVCAVSAGLLEYVLEYIGGQATTLVDIIIGVSTGLIGGLFYRYSEEGHCLSAIFLGTLYWFFYGTAFVIGLLEIIAGELETGVTRFMAVSIKTLVLSLGASLGLMLGTFGDTRDAWFSSQKKNCGNIDLDELWWRIPLYLLCSASALGQFRLPLVHYWRGLVVQLCAYEVQYQILLYLSQKINRSNLGIASSNVVGAAAGVISACALSFVTDKVGHFYYARLLQKDQSKNSKIGNYLYQFMVFFVSMITCLRIGRESDILKIRLEKKLRILSKELRDNSNPRHEIRLEKKDENILLETIVSGENQNIWSILMPALYQLVPGSLIAKLWFSSIFPPQSATAEQDVFSSLMVTSMSLALGLIIGLAAVQTFSSIFWYVSGLDNKSRDERKRSNEMMTGMVSAPITLNDDPVFEEKNSPSKDDDASDVKDDNEMQKSN